MEHYLEFKGNPCKKMVLVVEGKAENGMCGMGVGS